MRNNTIRDRHNSSQFKNKSVEWLLYLPGAVIIGYGLWLSITLN